nr:hypothetical protein [Tanacetum cinerariifolium]
MPRCAFKVDIQKAYDTIDWEFLRRDLVAFGFHHRMIAWIMECVTTTLFLICINGSLHGHFLGKHGLQQGRLKKGRAKVSWDLVYRPRNEGGLGIRKLDLFNKALMAVHLWNLILLKDSLWVKWIHAYKLKNRSFWDISIRGNMTWGWRKILQLCPVIRDYIWPRLSDRMQALAWFDKWCNVGLLSHWPHEWNSKYPTLASLVPPMLVETPDQLEWRDLTGHVKKFDVAMVWETIRPHYDVVSWHDVVWPGLK